LRAGQEHEPSGGLQQGERRSLVSPACSLSVTVPAGRRDPPSPCADGRMDKIPR
jgi:hypothetical protein